MDMLINSIWTQASDGAFDAVTNPATGETIDTVPRATMADVDAAVAAAQSGRRFMADLPAYRRYEILEAVARRIEANQANLGAKLCRENGKRLAETTSEVGVAARIFRGYAEEAKRIFGRTFPLDTIPGREKSLALTTREPVGVVVAIVPFNYPVELWSHKVAGGLAAGNAVITKPPEDCPLVMLEIARYLEEAGLPKAAHQVVTGGREVGEALVRAPDVQMITMTGSTAAGIRILEVAAKTLKKVHVELGGNDATIVCADADIPATAAALVAGRFTSGNGQICCAVKRVLVQRSVYAPLLEAVVAITKSLRIGDPSDSATDVGPLINRRGAERVEAQIAQAVADGAVVVAGGTRRDNFIEPTILTGVTPGTPAFAEETFGPVLPFLVYDDFEEALTLANDSPYGLQAAIFTNDMRRIMRAYEVLDVGTVVVNHTTAVRVETLPFGGNRGSGNTREGMHDTLHDMTKQKTLLLSEVFGAI
ncbi:aldehyde dehydrogenase family protein [Devosia sp. YIM 151766]|uniref:aldehyde dehydrogenase family protein n=1 Tax=Devosia sp. YIM 151766 TaxID=3017325 RepID=UPI00255C6F28|nr:aldehyde dehydrogenase family protein [Devosia sp. YIM 151766]WIY52596.1 aldehyde dehydrogenase family protein [Devosia sp. YIM 151766]